MKTKFHIQFLFAFTHSICRLLEQLFARKVTVSLWVVIVAISSAAMATGDVDPEEIVIGPEIVFENRNLEAAWALRTGAIAPAAQVLTGGRWAPYGSSPQNPTEASEGAAARRLVQAIQANCGRCEVTTIRGKVLQHDFRISFENGLSVVVSVDPGVVNLHLEPRPLREFRALENFIQEKIYNVAESVDLHPTTRTDGHTNIGARSAFSNVTEFANFIQDQVSHPELALGVMGLDINNAPPLLLLSEEQIASFHEIMGEVHSGRIRTIRSLAAHILDRVYRHPTGFETTTFDPLRAMLYQAVSLERLVRPDFPEVDQPVELRNTAGRKDFRTVLLNFELFTKRIQFLKRRGSILSGQAHRRIQATTMSPSEKLSRFYIFVTEMGEDINKYMDLVFDGEIKEARLDAFASAVIDFRNRESINEISRYIDDLADSDWIRNRMYDIITFPDTPRTFAQQLIRRINQKYSIENSSLRITPEMRAFMRQIYQVNQRIGAGVSPAAGGSRPSPAGQGSRSVISCVRGLSL